MEKAFPAIRSDLEQAGMSSILRRFILEEIDQFIAECKSDEVLGPIVEKYEPNIKKWKRGLSDGSLSIRQFGDEAGEKLIAFEKKSGWSSAQLLEFKKAVKKHMDNIDAIVPKARLIMRDENSCDTRDPLDCRLIEMVRAVKKAVQKARRETDMT